jgi:hypothetical protein
MKVSEARELAEALGLRVEKVRGEDAWIVRDLHTDVRVAHRLTFNALVDLLRREEAKRRLVWGPGDVQVRRS